jgi:hypothetical protein
MIVLRPSLIFIEDSLYVTNRRRIDRTRRPSARRLGVIPAGGPARQVRQTSAATQEYLEDTVNDQDDCHDPEQ